MQGSGIDSSLNNTGQLQAQAFFQHYKHIPFDAIYTSQLKRSKESISLFLTNGITHQSSEALNEINWGSKEGTNITPEEDAYYHWLLKQWQSGNTSLKIEGGESPEDVAQRQVPFIQKMLSKNKEKTILICMHGRAIRIFLCQLLNYPLYSMDLFEHRNLGLYLLTYTGSMIKVEGFNEDSHLHQIR